MSTKHGTAAVVDEALAVAATAIEPTGAGQVDLFDEPDSEEILEARERLGPNASHLAVVQDARAVRRGRPAGSRNRRTDDLVAYLSQFGPDPAVAAMRIIAESEELMVQRSVAMGDGKRRMTFAEARAIRMRMIEHMTPYWHGKKPVQVDMSFSGLSDLVIAGITHTAEQVQDVIDAEFLPIDGGEGKEG